MRFTSANRSHPLIAAAATACFLGGICDDDYLANSDFITAGAGDAVARNMVVQMIDPWPAHARQTAIFFDGPRLEVAMQRYQANATQAPPSQAAPLPAASAAVTASVGN